MDDSERSYGYSQDIYHGRRRRGSWSRDTGGIAADPGGGSAERSYEYGHESGMGGDVQDGDRSPEQAAMRVRRGRDPDRSLPRAGLPPGSAGVYDYGRGGEYSEVDSFTWENAKLESGGE